MTPRRRIGWPLGRRREVALLVPVALALLLALAVFTLLSYRSAVDQLLEESRLRVERYGRIAAAELAEGDSGADVRLAAMRHRWPGLQSILLLDRDGRVLAASGAVPDTGPLAPFAEAGPAPASPPAPGAPPASRVAGPGGNLPGAVAALVPLPAASGEAAGGETDRGAPPRSRAGAAAFLRLDLAVPVLAGRQRAMNVLTAVVGVVGLSAGALVLLLVGQALRPYDEMLARAHRVGPAEISADGDEIEHLLRTFERGMAALSAGKGDAAAAAGDDLAAVERAFALDLESGVLLLDRRGAVLALNPAGAELLGVGVPQAGVSLEQALASHGDLVRRLEEVVEDGRALHREELALERRGETVTLGMTAHPLRRRTPASEEGGVRGFLVLFADLTEVRRQREEARLADSLARLGELAAGVAHELRNSLATIRGYLTLIERSPEESPQGFLAEIRRETEHLQRVLEDFLAFARPETARVETVSLAAVASRAATDPALTGVEVVVETAPGVPPMKGDPQLLERALGNLLHNAVEATLEAASTAQTEPVRLRLAPRAGGIELLVEDRGAGVDPDLADLVFQPFVIGRAGGVGLGLSLAHRIVTLHGGTLRLEPRPDGGTRATVTFPPEAMATANGGG